jgi:hypothetical protein
MTSKKPETISPSDLPIKDLKKFKEGLLSLELNLGRKINGFDIIGEIEVCDLLGYKLVKSPINEGYDAVDGKEKIQIKATRAKKNTSRTSVIKKKNKSLEFDFILLARYNESLDLFELYKMSEAKCEDWFETNNSNEKREARTVSHKEYNTMSIGQFIKEAEEVYDCKSKKFIKSKYS